MTPTGISSHRQRNSSPLIALIAVLPVLAAAGAYLVPLRFPHFTLYAFRIVVLVIAFYSLTAWRLRGSRDISWAFARFGAFWALWAGLSSFWAPDLEAALTNALAIAFGTCVVVALMALGANREDRLIGLSWGWLVALGLSTAIAGWEMLTGNHLPSPRLTLPSYFNEDLAWAFFGSPNNLAAFTVLAVPFLILGFKRSRGVRALAFVVGLSLTPVLILATASRLGLLSLALEYGVFVAVVGYRRWSSRGRILIVGSLVLAMTAVLWSGSRMSEEFSRLFDDEGLVQADSVQVRGQLVLAGLEMAAKSYWIGVGAGGFPFVIEEGTVTADTRGMTSPHNFWIEVLAEYGVLVLAGMVLWLARLLKLGLQAYRHGDRTGVGEILLIGLAGYLPAAATNSSFVAQSSNWMFLAGMAMLGSSLQVRTSTDRRRHHQLPLGGLGQDVGDGLTRVKTTGWHGDAPLDHTGSLHRFP